MSELSIDFGPHARAHPASVVSAPPSPRPPEHAAHSKPQRSPARALLARAMAVRERSTGRFAPPAVHYATAGAPMQARTRARRWLFSAVARRAAGAPCAPWLSEACGRSARRAAREACAPVRTRRTPGRARAPPGCPPSARRGLAQRAQVVARQRCLRRRAHTAACEHRSRALAAGSERSSARS